MLEPVQTGEFTEASILEILREKHTKGLFVDHCKTGPSYFSQGQAILDAWVMPYSWTKPIIGYEVKVSRGDFVRDHKWVSYLPYCNLFYFVCPHGLIEAREVREEAGLIWISKTGKAIRYIKRAPFRWWHTIPPSIFQYVIMWRNNQPC
ncbi:MAG: hypothetical protein IMZ69_03170 [Spirochaetes bacterium]|nr:hypothetical protein [Spirochaetota bacterium]